MNCFLSTTLLHTHTHTHTHMHAHAHTQTHYTELASAVLHTKYEPMDNEEVLRAFW